MEQNPASRPNVVSLFFGMAMIVVLIAVLAASLFFNRLPEPQPTDPALLTQSQQPGYSYTEAAATQTVHNKALLIVLALGSMVAAAITGMLIISNLGNRRIQRQLAQQRATTTAVWQSPKGVVVKSLPVMKLDRQKHTIYYN